MKKRFLLMFLIATMFVFTACSNNSSIIIYSSMEEERNQELTKRVKEKFPDLDVVVRHIGTGNSAAKIKNEGTSIEADIILDLETSHINSLKENFDSLSGFDKSHYLDGLNKDDNYITWTKYNVGLIIDNKYFTENNIPIPKSYDDLLNPIYKNLIAMPDPTTSGSGYAFLLNVVNLKGEDGAIDYFKKLKENMREFTTSGSGPTNLLKQGEIKIAMGMYSQGAKAITDGYNFSIVELDTGSPYNTTSAGIIKGKNNDDVKELFQWLITDYSKIDIEEYVPGNLFKDQTLKIKNYPETINDADMTNIESSEIKEKLSKRWEEVNG